MAAGVTERLQIVAGGDAGLLHREVRKQMAAGRVDVAEAEALAALIGKRANGALLARDEQRMEALIDIALPERCEAVTRVRLPVGDRKGVRWGKGGVRRVRIRGR